MISVLKYFLTPIAMTLVFSAYAQNNNDKKFRPQFSQINLSFHYQLQLNQFEFSPAISANIQPKTVLGAGLCNALYFKDADRDNQIASGIRFFGRWFPIDQLFIHGEYMWTNVPIKNQLDYSFNRGFKADLLFGIGYQQKLGSKWFAAGEILYNPIYSDLSFYGSKLIARVQIGRSISFKGKSSSK